MQNDNRSERFMNLYFMVVACEERFYPVVGSNQRYYVLDRERGESWFVVFESKDSARLAAMFFTASDDSLRAEIQSALEEYMDEHPEDKEVFRLLFEYEEVYEVGTVKS